MAFATNRPPWYRRHFRVVFALSSGIAYVAMWAAVVACSIAAARSAESLTEELGSFVMTMFVGSIWGHIVWCFVIARFLPRPRPVGRIAVLGVVMPFLVVLSMVAAGFVGVMWVMTLAPTLGAVWVSGGSFGSLPGVGVAAAEVDSVDC